MLGAGLRATISRAMAALLRMLRIASPGGKAPWSELPPEMLALVLSRLPTHTDRVRVRAVCQAWRSAARLHPLPPPLPWLFLRGDTFVTLPDGARHCIRRPLDCNRTPSSFPTGSMLFLVNGSCYLTNPCSGETTPLHIQSSTLPIDIDCRSYNWIRKVVVSDRIVAVPHSGMITIFRRGARAITMENLLLRGHIVLVPPARNGVPDPGLPASQTWRFSFYLVGCGNRLLMVESQTVEQVPLPVSRRSRPTRTQFEVWVAVDLIGGSHGRWSKVDTLMGHALFDCIYSVTEYDGFVPRQPRDPEGDVLDCVVYNLRDRTMEPLTLERRAPTGGP
ncbi:hypothetical protein VPH35_050098 [Triticum aestivum]